MKNIETIKTDSLTWINIKRPTPEAMKYLRTKYKFHPLDFEDCLTPSQHAKLDEYDNYLFMTLLLPIYNRKTKEILSEEVNFFIGNNFLITSHNNLLPPLMKIFDLVKYNQEYKTKMFTNDPSILIYEIINNLLKYCFPMLNHIGKDIDEVRKKIFAGYERRHVRHILDIKRNIVNYRKIMRSHNGIYRKLLTKAEKLFPTTELKVYFDNLVEQSIDIWNILDNHKENIDALQETNESLISFRLNDIMKILTIISVTLLPASIIANIFGMNILENLPYIHHPAFFYVVMLSMAVGTTVMFLWFKKKDWL